MMAYQRFNDGAMTDYVPGDDQISASLEKLPKVKRISRKVIVQ